MVTKLLPKLKIPLSVSVLLMFLFNITAVIEGTEKALKICALSIIPSLFLFMILSDIIVSMMLSLGVPIPAKSVAFLLGMLCGFPVGAAVCNRLYEKGVLSENDAAKLSAVTNGASPAFILGAIGTTMFGDIKIGLLLYISQLLTSLILSCSLRVESRSEISPECPAPFLTIFLNAVEKSIYGILRVCAMICAFSALTSVIESTVKSEYAICILSVFLEIGTAVSKCSGYYLDAPVPAVTLCAFACGWSGICVHFQIFSALRSVKVNTFPFIIFKFLQGILCAFFACIGYKLFFCY